MHAHGVRGIIFACCQVVREGGGGIAFLKLPSAGV